MFGLITALIGVAVATLGVFLFIGNRYRGGRRGLAGELLSLSLLLGGGAVLLASVDFNPLEHDSDTANNFDPNLLLEQEPTAAGNPNPARRARILDGRSQSGLSLPYSSVQILTWGTPSDVDDANEDGVATYSAKLQDLAQDIVKGYAGNLDIHASTLSHEEYQSFVESMQAMTSHCQKDQKDSAPQLILAIVVDAKQLNNQDYALWREPVYGVLDCSTEQLVTRIGKVNEKPGDLFPYQLAIHSDVASLLDEFSLTQ